MADKTLRIYGCTDRPALKEDIRKVCNFLINKLLPRKKILHITIKRRKNLIKNNGTYGECWQLDKPHSFEIVLDGGVSRKTCLTTLAHELVHVKQFSTKELKFGHSIDTWRGKKYYHGAAYESLPWEKEATQLETKLYDAYQNHNKIV